MSDETDASNVADLKNKFRVDEGNQQRIGSAIMSDKRKAVFLDKIVNRDRTLMLLIGRAAADRIFVERNGDQPLRLV